ncbi:MAG: hypothetical protein HYY16_15040 [Planctomycetes bacterium]|nr:hypothetical protein [Planctomycetota bacterium]
MSRRTNQAGSALPLVTILTLVITLLTAGYLTLSFSKHTDTFRQMAREQAFRMAEAGIAHAMCELNTTANSVGDTNLAVGAVGSAASPVSVGRQNRYYVEMGNSGLQPNQTRLVATGIFGDPDAVSERCIRRIEVIVVPPVPPVVMQAVPGMGAVMARDFVDINGNIDIDGRDWNDTGTALVGPGTMGVVSGGIIAVGGSAGVGGNAVAPPARGAAAGSTDANHDWTADGVDNNNDGITDEAGEGFPASPDEALGLPSGILKQAAMTTGTYFSTQADYTAYVSTHGGRFPSGKIVYCDFDPSPPFEFGTGYNADPSILVVHNDTGTAVMKNLHGDFKGLLFADKVEHVNAGTQILGMVVAWGQAGNVFGNGNATIRFSSAVLQNLPSPSLSTSAVYSVVFWRENLDAQP